MTKLETVALMYSLKALIDTDNVDKASEVINKVLEAAEVEGVPKAKAKKLSAKK